MDMPWYKKKAKRKDPRGYMFMQMDEQEAAQIAAIIMAGAVVIGYVIGKGLVDSTNKERREFLCPTNWSDNSFLVYKHL